MLSGLAKFRDALDVGTGAEGGGNRTSHDDAADFAIACEGVERAAHGKDHVEAQRVERSRAAERNDAAAANLLPGDLGFAHHPAPSVINRARSVASMRGGGTSEA